MARLTSLTIFLLMLAQTVFAADKPRILFLTQSKGFTHGSVKRPEGTRATWVEGVYATYTSARVAPWPLWNDQGKTCDGEYSPRCC